jgi:DNA polymerase-3 subunit delta
MRLRFDQLPQQLQKGLLPCYLLSGDEPLQMGEAADGIRAAARTADYATRTVFEVDAHFKWGELMAEADSLSLFSDKKVIDLRIPSGKPGTEGSKNLVAYAERPPPDTLLLITMPKLERSQLSGKWVKALDKLGALIQIWPIEGRNLLQWLEQRMHSRGLVPEREVVGMLAERVEGNLLAASQEVDKLLLLQGPGPVTAEQLLEASSDSARFDVFKLVDAALMGNAARCIRILQGLRAEGVAEPVVLWALARETRLLAGIRSEVDGGRTIQQVLQNRRDVWDKRRPLVSKGVSRLNLPRLQRLLQTCALADRAIKGRAQEDPWLLFEEILVALARP